MTGAVLLVTSDGCAPPADFARIVAQGRLIVTEESELSDEMVDRAAGLITTMHLDQVAFAERRPVLERFFDRGGRLAFMGHLVRPFLPDLGTFVPLASGRRADFVLTALADHPIFAGIDRSSLETRRGVAGFYGRGHVPPPEGATGLTGLGRDRVPVDWVWERPAGGAIFLHAGNDLWGIADDPAVNAAFAERLVDWCEPRSAETASGAAAA